GRLRPRAGGADGAGRGEVRRGQRGAVRNGAGAVLRAVRVGELVHAAGGPLPPARRHPEALAPARRRATSRMTFVGVGLSMPSPKDKCFSEFFELDFFQAVRLLEKLAPKRAAIGLDGPPEAEVARFRPQLSLAFPPSQIVELEPPTEERPNPLLTVAFFGL